jgi:hypothetical protein
LRALSSCVVRASFASLRACGQVAWRVMAEMEAWERKSREVERSKGKLAERGAEVDEVCFILHGFRPLRGPTFHQTAVVCPDAGAQVELAETLVKNAVIAVPPQTWNIDLADAQDPGLRISQGIILQLFHGLLTLTSIDLYCTNTHKYSTPLHTHTHTHTCLSLLVQTGTRATRSCSCSASASSSWPTESTTGGGSQSRCGKCRLCARVAGTVLADVLASYDKM